MVYVRSKLSNTLCDAQKTQKNQLTNPFKHCILYKTNSLFETDEAEIKVIMRAQRVWDAENQIEEQIAKWTAEGTVKGS